jgi:hypothetical protein
VVLVARKDGAGSVQASVIAPGAYGRVARKDGAGSVQASVSLHPAHMDAYKAHFFLSYLL